MIRNGTSLRSKICIQVIGRYYREEIYACTEANDKGVLLLVRSHIILIPSQTLAKQALRSLRAFPLRPLRLKKNESLFEDTIQKTLDSCDEDYDELLSD